MRPISETERRVLDLLLSAEFEGVEDLRAQANHIVGVETNCTCGCPSITLEIDQSLAPRAHSSSMLPAELWESERRDGIERSVICFLDEDGFLSNLECVYLDDATDQWPDLDTCAVLISGSGRGLAKIQLPSGATVTPQDPGDRWLHIGFEPEGLGAETQSGWRETYSSDGRLTARVSLK